MLDLDDFDFTKCMEYVVKHRALNADRYVNDIVQDYAMKHHHVECQKDPHVAAKQVEKITKVLTTTMINKLINEINDDETKEILQELRDLA